jgi:hypothetical protein
MERMAGAIPPKLLGLTRIAKTSKWNISGKTPENSI